MFKFTTSIKKELIILFSDKLGLTVMFVMPMLLVFIITIIQDSAYKIVNESKLSMLVSNQDEGGQGEVLFELMDASGFFILSQDDGLNSEALERALIDDNQLAALYIPADFSSALISKANQTSETMMSELGVMEASKKRPISVPELELYIDPVLQENFSESISRMLSSYLNVIENKLMIRSVYKLMEQDLDEEAMIDQMLANQVEIVKRTASTSDKAIIPNSTQHNVPAWTLFAMFFMVVSLGSNVVKERINGSFMRLKTMPSSFVMVLVGKMLVYVVVAMLQIAVIFGISMLIFPSLDLPVLVLPDNVSAFVLMSLLSSLAAVSFSLMIGTISQTMEQCIGIGAVSVIIFGAIGGIWVPTFVMPGYMQTLTAISPLHWCLEGFYILFLKGGSWKELFPIIVYIVAFVLVCQAITLSRLRIEKLL
ncbi:ABC-2 type transport system permease protein [Reichenbachiella agariperforans]|uniref:ABC-2 type transport system permease protein n=1 Tax=Reichenbachiella agariperforans TaxID=156994 RepID=A0A1M6WJ68_REIAG|nr:ABC transporter permease [Reichenbachiella agariperforans]SHK93800.1 ABC-2 type transport system permease protein [Reichenbachiella agariperforans]